MRTSWSAFHLQLLALCHRRSAEQLFGEMGGRHPALNEVTCVDALLNRQHDMTDPSVPRHAVVRALVIEAQGVGPSSNLAATILILALWPGLDVVRHRLWRDWPDARDNLADDILGQITIGIRRLKLTLVRQVAATLIMNTERDIRRSMLERKAQRRTELPIHDSPQDVASSDDQLLDVGIWRNRLQPMLGRDTELVLRTMILGETQAEAARALGLSHDVARKRHQRAIAKLAAMQINSGDLSHSGPPVGL